MKNWKIILWLLVFFPVGLYLMHKHTDWSMKIQYPILGLFIFYTAFLTGSNLWLEHVFIQSSLLIFIGLIFLISTFLTKRKRRSSLVMLGLGIVLFGCTYSQIESKEAEKEALELAEQQKQEKIQKEKQLKDSWKIIEENVQKKNKKEKKIKDEIKEALKLIEQKPTQNNYDQAVKLLGKLTIVDEDLEKELEKLEPSVLEYEKSLELAIEALEKAEENQKRSSYEEAEKLISGLIISNPNYEKRLDDLDEKITEKEIQKTKEEKKKKEAKEKAKKEEDRRKAKESAKRKEKERKETEKEKQESDSSGEQYVDENGNGLIKGSKNKIYHVPGSTYYDRTTNPAAWFKTIKEAENAGYRAPKR